MTQSTFMLVMPTAALGRLILLPSQLELSGMMDEDSFRSSTEGAASTVWVSNPPHVSYRLSTHYGFADRKFRMSVRFSFSRLATIGLSPHAAEVALSDWSTWDLGSKLADERDLISLIIHLYGSHPVTFDWGTMSAAYDPRHRSDPECS